MAEPFGASFLKIERARKHLQELELVVQAYLDSNPVAVTTKIEGRGIFLKMKSRPVPEVASAIVGDIFHNLRSSLDLMASELCRINGENADDVYFPFSGTEDDLDYMIGRRNFNKAGPNAVRLLKEFRPYKGGNIELRAIHDLNIRDKHQMLLARPISFASPIIDTRPPDGTGLAIVGDSSKPSEIKLLFPPDCSLAGKELIPMLHELVQITAGVVEAFKSLSVPAGQPPV